MIMPITKKIIIQIKYTPVNLFQPLIYTCSMKLMIAGQYPHEIPILILHKANITPVVNDGQAVLG